MGFLRYGAILVMLAVSLAAHSAEYISYSGPNSFFGGEVDYRIDATKGTTSSLDSTQDAYICGPESAYFCFDDRALAFYVPKNLPSIGSAWKAADRAYKLERRETIQLFGKLHMVYEISSVSDKHPTVYYYYSLQEGLIAIKVTATSSAAGRCDYSELFFLVGDVGFPIDSIPKNDRKSKTATDKREPKEG